MHCVWEKYIYGQSVRIELCEMCRRWLTRVSWNIMSEKESTWSADIINIWWFYQPKWSKWSAELLLHKLLICSADSCMQWNYGTSSVHNKNSFGNFWYICIVSTRHDDPIKSSSYTVLTPLPHRSTLIPKLLIPVNPAPSICQVKRKMV